MLKRLLANGLLRNSVWMIAGQCTSLGLQGTYFVVLARLLGVTQYGLLAGATSLIALASQYSSLGAGFIFLRQVSPDLSKFRLYWGYLLTATFLGGAAIVLTVIMLSHWILRDIGVLTVVFLAISDSFFAQITSSSSRVFQAFERMHFTAIVSLLTNCLRLAAALTLLNVMHHAKAVEWALAQMSVSALAAIAAVTLVTSCFGKPDFSVRLVRGHLYEGLLFSSSISTSAAYNDIDKVLLGHYGMNTANGIYSMAYRTIDTAFMAVRAIHNAAFPSFCREGALGIEKTIVFARKLLRKTFWLSLAISALLFTTAPLIPLFLGKAFAPSVLALRWLCLIPVFRSFHLSAGDALAGAGHQQHRFVYELCAAIANFGLNIWLIPIYSWKGAAVASLLTDGGLAITSWITVRYVAVEARREHRATDTVTSH